MGRNRRAPRNFQRRPRNLARNGVPSRQHRGLSSRYRSCYAQVCASRSDRFRLRWHDVMEVAMAKKRGSPRRWLAVVGFAAGTAVIAAVAVNVSQSRPSATQPSSASKGGHRGPPSRPGRVRSPTPSLVTATRSQSIPRGATRPFKSFCPPTRSRVETTFDKHGSRRTSRATRRLRSHSVTT